MLGCIVDRLSSVPTRHPSGRSGSGFTTIELIVVMILIGIIGSIGASRFFDRQAFDTVGFADKAKGALHFAQKEAIAQHRPVHVYFDGSAVRLCFAAGATCAPIDQVPAPFTASTGGVCNAVSWYCLQRPTNVTASLTGEVAFDDLGRPTDANGNVLPSAVTVTISGGGTSVPITIEPETGYVH